jgi:hypothetical protein
LGERVTHAGLQQSPAILFGVLLVLVVLVFSVPVADPDLGWQMAIGRDVLDQREVPRQALYTSLPHDPPIAVNDWLGGTLFELSYRALGFAGIVLVRVLAIVALTALLLIVTRGPPAWLGVILTLVAIAGASFRLIAERPQLFGYLCEILAVALLCSSWAYSRRGLFFFGLLQILWTQFHGSSLLGPPLGVAALAAAALARLRPQRFTATRAAQRPSLLFAALLPLVAIVGLCMGPMGPSVLFSFLPFDQAVWDHLAARSVVREWMAPTPGVLFAVLPAAGPALVAMIGIYAAALFTSRIRQLRALEIALLVGFLALALRAVRFVPDFLLVAPILVIPAVREALPRWNRRLAALVGAPILACLVAFAFQLATDPAPRLAFRARSAWFPQGAVAALHQAGEGVVCNSFEFGGYLHYFLAPRVRPYVDGRLVSAYPLDHLLEWTDAASGPEAMVAFAARHHLIGCVIAYPDPRMAALFPRQHWGLVQIDDVSATFLRRDQLGALQPLDAIDPINPWRSISAAARSPAVRARLEADLDRAEALTADRFLLTAIRARLALALGQTDRAAELTKLARDRFPGRESYRYSRLSAEQVLDAE